MKKITLISLSLLVFFVFSPCARADVWSQLWQQSSSEIWNGQEVGPFDEIAVWASGGSGMVFADPAFSDFSVPGWTVYNEPGNTGARAYTPAALDYVLFNMNYASQSGTADFLYMSAYQGEVRQRQHMTYASNTGWSYPAFTGSDTEWHALGGGDPIAVPEPSMLFMLGSILPFLPYITRR
ncbi:MAG: hypothetical protein PHR22_02175 [Candidatus Omnitrophica bacterium]|nr:hypothetical protein [Candidatus Omnitrophota bacterium]